MEVGIGYIFIKSKFYEVREYITNKIMYLHVTSETECGSTCRFPKSLLLMASLSDFLIWSPVTVLPVLYDASYSAIMLPCLRPINLTSNRPFLVFFLASNAFLICKSKRRVH